MKDKINLQKKVKKIMIIMIVIILPSLFRIIDSDAFESVRNIDIAVLFVSGMCLGALLILIRVQFFLRERRVNIIENFRKQL